MKSTPVPSASAAWPLVRSIFISRHQVTAPLTNRIKPGQIVRVLNDVDTTLQHGFTLRMGRRRRLHAQRAAEGRARSSGTKTAYFEGPPWWCGSRGISVVALHLIPLNLTTPNLPATATIIVSTRMVFCPRSGQNP
jgi:hypothetical protein